MMFKILALLAASLAAAFQSPPVTGSSATAASGSSGSSGNTSSSSSTSGSSDGSSSSSTSVKSSGSTNTAGTPAAAPSAKVKVEVDLGDGNVMTLDDMHGALVELLPHFQALNDEGALLSLRPLIRKYVGDDMDEISFTFEGDVAPALLDEEGRPRTEEAAFLGVSTSPALPQTVAQLPLRRGTGLTVLRVTEGSPAAEAGFERYDVLAKLDDQLLVNAEQLAALIRSYDAGATVNITYYRGGKEMSASVKLGSRTQPVLAPGGRRTNLGFDLQGPAQFFGKRLDGAADWKAIAEDAAVSARRLAQREIERHMQAHSDEKAARILQERLIRPRGEATPRPMARRHVSGENENMVWDDGSTRIERSRQDGEVLFVIVDEGQEIYRGGMPEGAARESLAPHVREKLAAFMNVKLPNPPPTPPPPMRPGAASPGGPDGPGAPGAPGRAGGSVRLRNPAPPPPPPPPPAPPPSDAPRHPAPSV